MKTNSNKKGFSFSALIMAVAAFFGFGAHVAPITSTTISTSTEITATTSIVIENQNNIATSTEGWKTYTNEKLSFKIDYPSNWKITDRSTIDGTTKYLGLNIESPLRYDLPGYVGTSERYLILFSGLSTKPDIIAEFGSPESGHNSPWNADITKQIKENTDEYKIGQQIIQSFNITN